MSVNAEKILRQNWQLSADSPPQNQKHAHSPIEFPLLNDSKTDWNANAVGISHLGLGNACSRYTTSDPDRFGKYAVYSRYTDKLAIDVKNPSAQYTIDSPTEPVPLRIVDATHGPPHQLALTNQLHRGGGVHSRVE
jgi:hypothetical protein